MIPTLDATLMEVRECLRNVKATVRVPHELIVIDNGAPPQGVTAPVNAGLRAARGRNLVVLNDDVEVLDGWWEPLARALDAGTSVVFPTTIDGKMSRFPAWCFAMRRDTLERFAVAPGEFLDPAMSVWAWDTDLLLRLAAGRCPARVRPSVPDSPRLPPHGRPRAPGRPLPRLVGCAVRKRPCRPADQASAPSGDTPPGDVTRP